MVAAIALWMYNATPVGHHELVLAGWASAPVAADGALASAAAAACAAGGDDDTALPMIAQDQRGNAATLLFAGGGQLSICLMARDDTGQIVAAASGMTRLVPTSSSLSVDSGLGSPATPGAPALTIVAGRVDGSVATVTITRTDGVAVTATVSSGYFVAWWPTDAEAKVVRAANSAGAVISSISDPLRP
jgi:hypothetical protein